jgi:rod shape determining protein RodA
MYFVEKTREAELINRFDFFIAIPVLLLNILGLFAVKSATLSMGAGGERIFMMQVIGLVIGILAGGLIGYIDYKDLKTLSVIFYIGSVVLLVVVLFAGSGDSLGSRSWLNIAGVSVQPAEVTKITFIIVVAIYLEKLYNNEKRKNWNVIKLVVFSFIPVGLVILQRDYGTTMVFIGIFFVMLIAFGIKYKYLLIMFGTFLMTTPFIWFYLLNDRRKERILTFIDPSRDQDKLGAAFNVERSKMTIGSGQLTGKGLFQGIQTQNSSVPVKESDFIMSVIGEEGGFIAVVVMLVLISWFLVRCVYIAKNSRDPFGSFLVIGVSGLFAIHFIENIGMSIGLLPVTGIPLPFISAGGSFLVTNYIAVGIILSVSARRNKVILSKKRGNQEIV